MSSGSMHVLCCECMSLGICTMKSNVIYSCLIPGFQDTSHVLRMQMEPSRANSCPLNPAYQFLNALVLVNFSLERDPLLWLGMTDDTTEVGTSGAGSAASINHFLFLLGHVALQHLVRPPAVAVHKCRLGSQCVCLNAASLSGIIKAASCKLCCCPNLPAWPNGKASRSSEAI